MMVIFIDRGKLVIMCYHMNILQLDKKPTGKDPIIRLGLNIGNTPIQVIQSASPILYTDLNIFRRFFKKPHSDFRKACFKKKVLPIHFRFICFSCIQLPLHRSIICKTFPNFKISTIYRKCVHITDVHDSITFHCILCPVMFKILQMPAMECDHNNKFIKC